MSRTLCGGSEDTCRLSVSLVELWEFRVGWVELDETEENFERCSVSMWWALGSHCSSFGRSVMK